MRGPGLIPPMFTRGSRAERAGTAPPASGGEIAADRAEAVDQVDTEVIDPADPSGQDSAEQLQPTLPLGSAGQDPPAEDVGILARLVLRSLPGGDQWRGWSGALWGLFTLTPRRAPLSGTAATAAAGLWPALTGLLLALAVAVASAAEAPVGAAAWIWLAANHIPVSTDAGTVTLLPLGLMLLALLPLRRAGRYLAARHDPAGRRGAAVAAVAVYAVTAVIVAAAWGGGHFAPLSAAAWAVPCAAVGIGWGIARGRTDRRLPRPPVLTGILRAAAAPLVLGSLLVAAGVVVTRESVIVLQAGLAEGPAEHLGLVLLQIAYLPNLIVWAGAYAIGGGVMFGAEPVSPYADGAPLLPDLPLLQVFTAPAPDWTAMLPIVIAVAAALAAAAANRGHSLVGLGHRISRAVVMAAGCGVAWFALSALAGGSLGDERLADVGPAAITPLLLGVEVLAGTLLWAILPTVASDAKPVAGDIRERVVKSKDTLAAAAARRKG